MIAIRLGTHLEAPHLILFDESPETLDSLRFFSVSDGLGLLKFRVGHFEGLGRLQLQVAVLFGGSVEFSE